MLGGESFRTGIVACLFTGCFFGCALKPSSTTSVTPAAATQQRESTEPLLTSGDTQDLRRVADTLAADDLWHRIIVELRMTPPTPAHIKTAMHHFERNADFVSAATRRAEPYLHFIYQEIERRRLPFEITLLPIIESGYAPRATSPDGAAGIWQLMTSTGHRFRLHQSRWYDGRRDIIASTGAALDYLEELRDQFFGDWPLAFAAYNCGARTVERAIERNRRAGLPTDFWSLDLPRETEHYVPRLLALVEILSHPEAHAVNIAQVSEAPYFEFVDVGGGLDLNHVIEWSGMSAEDFEALNPGFRTRYSIVGAPTTLLVRKGHSSAVTNAVAGLTEAERGAPRRHTVVTGETLSHIAAKTGVTVATIKRANGMRTSRIRAGQDLLIPSPGSIEDAGDAFDTDNANAAVHVIVRGDTLWDIARRYGTTVNAIAMINTMRRDETLRPGQELRLPGGVAEHSDGTPLHYEVKQGDSLWTISRRFNVSIADLKKWNRLSGKRYLQPGQKLVVYQSADDQQQEI